VTNLIIIGNHALSDVTGLNNIHAISGSLVVGGNNALSSLNGLEQLQYIAENLRFGIGAQLGWIGNQLLNNLTGLEGLTEIGGDLILTGNPLIDLEGLNNLAVIGNDLVMEDNYIITGLAGLDNLDTISGNFQIGPYPGTGGEWTPGGNASLVNFTGVPNLTSIGGDFVVCMNNSLTSLAGLENVTSIGGDLIIYHNDTLTSLAGLENIDAGSIEDLEIFYNRSLADCEIQSICNYLASPNGAVDINNNAPGCNSQAQVIEACAGVRVPEVSGRQSAVGSFPNPFNDGTTVEFELEHDGFVTLTVFDHLGKQVSVLVNEILTAGKRQVFWDASGLPAGIYICRLSNFESRTSALGKVVKY
jgi:hypothetical protein